MHSQNPLPRLREIRDQQRRAKALVAERDHLIRVAVQQGMTERQIAEASGLSQSMVHKIVITK